ncbi:hypothetical protein MMC20_004656 [Loxospora ochrophaea]|nr:hypothetical protein [Loxospora ochrophaea]
MAATELLVEIAQVDSNFSTVTSGGKSVISGTFSIYSKLCLPTHETATRNSSTLQFLTHGGTLDSSYWDIAPGYSYIDAAAAAGYATFSYDRLGSGRSDHPDPIQVVQLYLQIELAHVLVSWLKTAKLGGQFFSQIIGVGHSLGSGLTQAVTLKYPTDFSAVILTGHSAYFSSATIGTASTAQQIANTDPSGRFSSLGNAYLTPAPVPQSVQFAFYRYPYFDSQIFYSQFNSRQTNALGELLTLIDAYAPVPAYTGPVDIVDGQHDFFYCGGDCYFPVDQAAAALTAYYPAAGKGSQTFIVPNSGHNINAHYAAPQAFSQMINFLAVNGIK